MSKRLKMRKKSRAKKRRTSQEADKKSWEGFKQRLLERESQLEDSYIHFERFKVSGISYIFGISKDYGVEFFAYGGRVNGKDLGYDPFGEFDPIAINPHYDLLEGVENPMAVVRAVLKRLETTVRRFRLPYFQFSAYEEKRREVYSKFVPAIERLTGYKCSLNDTCYGKFIFHRQMGVESAMAA